MRILHLISSMAMNLGGPAEAVRLTAEIQARAGHAVEIATLDGPGEAGVEGVALHALGPGRGTFGYAPRLLPWLRGNGERFDAVIVHGLWQYHGLAARRAMRAIGKPYYVFPHGMLDPWFKRRYPLKHLKKWLYWPWADYRVLRDARAVLFTCEEEKRLAAESFWLYRANAVVTGLGSAGPSAGTEGAETFLARWPELRGRRLVLFMGRIHPKKGCDLLIDAFAQAMAGDAEWRLVMAGPDQVGWEAELRDRAQRAGIAERVVWTGMLRGEEKWGALRAAEVFALPSHQENFGIAVAEALACGTPVLISRRVNIWREIEACGAGLVGEDTQSGTADLLERWRGAGEEQRAGMRERAEACFREHFAMEASVERLMQVLREQGQR